MPSETQQWFIGEALQFALYFGIFWLFFRSAARDAYGKGFRDGIQAAVEIVARNSES